MNLTPLPVVIFTIGIILIYAAKKNKDPRDVLLSALGQRERYGPLSTPSTSGGNPSDPTDPRSQIPGNPNNPPWNPAPGTGTRWVNI